MKEKLTKKELEMRLKTIEEYVTKTEGLWLDDMDKAYDNGYGHGERSGILPSPRHV